MSAEPFHVPADAYDRFMGRYSAPLALALIDFADIESATTALDVGCGPGALAGALAARLGAAGVAAVDPSGPFVEACRRNLPGVEVVRAGAEELPFRDAAFDAALSQLALNFMRDARAGVREMTRVTRPGGVVASCVWDYAGAMTLLRAFWDAAGEVDPHRAAAADEGRAMPWCSEEALRELWRAGDLESVRCGSLVVSAAYRDFDDLWSPLLTGVGPAGAFCKSLDETERAALYRALRDRLDVDDQPFELDARAWAVAGYRPE